MNHPLRLQAGFEGWVMSDWGATHSMSINQGLDQEMPGGGHMGDTLVAAVKSGAVSQAKLDDSVSRILTQMYKFGALPSPRSRCSVVPRTLALFPRITSNATRMDSRTT